jgi:hypothetical protein
MLLKKRKEKKKKLELNEIEKNLDKEEFSLSTKNNKRLRVLLSLFMFAILFGIFILAAPGLLGERPIFMDEEHYEKYKVYKMVEYEDNIIFKIDKDNQPTQFQVKRENVKFSSDFELENPVLYIYSPEYIAYKNMFYTRKKFITKEDRQFKPILNQLNKRKHQFYLFKYVDNE